MSYRSIKRVLGETSLERKCRFLFGACLLVLITLSFWWYGTQTAELVHKQNPITGRLLVDTIMCMHHWEKCNTETDYKPNVKEMAANLEGQAYTWVFIKPWPTADQPWPTIDGEQVTDPDELQLVDQFKQFKPQIASEEITNEAGEYSVSLGKQDLQQSSATPHRGYNLPQSKKYVYYQPVYATRHNCVACHNTFRYGTGTRLGTTGVDGVMSGPLPHRFELGDLMAVMKVHIPTDDTLQDLSVNRAILISTAIITVFLAMVASYVIVRYVIVKPLKHLRDVSDAISHGNIDKRADIHTGDEFEALGVAFNRMLRHLVEAHQELRHVNADLDSKVDQLAQMNMRLYEMNRLKGDFLATMSHELRTPLNSIIGFSDVLGSISSLDDKQKRYVLNIQKSGKMLLDMINDILDLAKMESGKMEVRLTNFRISQVVGALCDMCRPLTEKKNIDLDCDVQSALPELYQDQNKIQQILNNLLSNAIKFTPEGGRIVVRAHRDEAGELVLVVADTGVGIAEEDQQNIFEKFRQGHVVLPSGDAMTREYSGTGLGLSIVKELCRLLEGEISLESQLGRGSIFTVRLPWTLPERPRLEGPMAMPLEELTKPRRGDFAASSADSRRAKALLPNP
jgi:signal transduction histidine kinase